jgi:hypothetical protein
VQDDQSDGLQSLQSLYTGLYSQTNTCTWGRVLRARGAKSNSPLATKRFCLKQRVLKSFCKSQFPYNSVSLFFILVMIQDRLTDLYGNCLLQKNIRNTLCEIRAGPRSPLATKRFFVVQPPPFRYPKEPPYVATALHTAGPRAYPLPGH